MRQLVVLVLIGLLVAPQPAWATLRKRVIVLSYWPRENMPVDLTGDGKPELISYQILSRPTNRLDKRGVFRVLSQDGRELYQNAITLDGRIIIWDFDPQRPGVEFICVCRYEGDDTGLHFLVTGFRWDKRFAIAGVRSGGFESYMSLSALISSPIRLPTILNSVERWVGRRQLTLSIVRQAQAAVKRGQSLQPFLAKEAWIQRGSLSYLVRMSCDPLDDYGYDGTASWTCQVPGSDVRVTVVLIREGSVYRIKLVKYDR